MENNLINENTMTGATRTECAVVWRGRDTCIPYERNTKKHPEAQVANIAESIRRFGFRVPVVVDRDGVIVCGHGRWLAAGKLGLPEIPCIVAEDLTPEQLRAFRVLDNKLAESPWETGALRLELLNIDLDGFDLDFKLPELEAGEGYAEFVDKFEPKLTTDDCFTPENVYQAVKEWAVERYGLQGRHIYRPFFPGGDYQSFNYGENGVVIDNPPFSILSETCRWYAEHGVDFFLFAPGLTLFSLASGEMNYIPVGATVTYANGAKVSTSFVTNMGENKIETAPELFDAIAKADADNKTPSELPKYEFPVCVVNQPVCRLAQHGVRFAVKPEECVFIRALDAQKDDGKAIFGAGFLLSEKAAAEKAAAENAAAENAAAEKEKAIVWELSEREKEIQRQLAISN